MDFFNFLKQKPKYSFEILLQKAADEPAYRAEFINRILNEKLIVITDNNDIQEGVSFLQKDTTISIFTYPDGRVPIFTSTDRIFDKGVIKEQVKFLKAKAEDLFFMLKGKSLILNPYSDYGKEFNSEEVERLLKGTYLSDNTRTIVVEKATEVKIGQPAKYPTEVVKSLIKLFSGKPDVVAAYLGWIYDPVSGDPPHYIFAIETKGNWSSLINEAGFTAKEILPKNEIIDFIRIDRSGGIEDYFLKSTKPFYVKAGLN